MSMEKRIEKLEQEHKPKKITSWLDLVKDAQARRNGEPYETVEFSEEWLPLIESLEKEQNE